MSPLGHAIRGTNLRIILCAVYILPKTKENLRVTMALLVLLLRFILRGRVRETMSKAWLPPVSRNVCSGGWCLPMSGYRP